ncbi:MAG TPA: putative sulfate exporter family transporter [Sphingomicrobium sp.]|nr:putative sulfate exporter family transporter [Sphingomicrobium sp.]
MCILVAAAGLILQRIELAASGRAWIEALVLAILVGAAVRTAWTPGKVWKRGIDFSAKLLLEIAVVLLGASVSAATIISAGWALLISILGIVAGAIILSFGIGRLLGLPKRLAILVACGNSICGNSAIAAVAPVIGADGDEVAASIAFTAVLGVIVVLVLPMIGTLLHMTPVAYGALAGLTVYAIPQVLAATAPAGATAMHIGTLVKLIRVLMLGPVCVVLSLISSKLREEPDEPAPHVTAGDRPRAGRPPLHRLVPWFVIGFVAMIGVRSTGLLPPPVLTPIGETATIFTVISMAALGLGVDVRAVSKAGGAVTITVVLSLLALGSVSFLLVRQLGL